MEYKTAEQAREEAKGLTFEDVWAALMEDRKRMNEYFARLDAERETERIAREAERAEREAERKAERVAREVERIERLEREKHDRKAMDDLRREFGRLGISYGDHVEAMFTNLGIKLNALGFDFTMETPNRRYIENNQVLAEADYLLENGIYVMLVEVKAKLTKDDVDRHLNQITRVRSYMDNRNDNRKITGAVAGGVVAENVISYAQNKGLYVITQNGEAVSIAALPDGFKPKEW